MVNELDKDKCVGCMSCGDICPVEAITFRDDLEGFWYPEIDDYKCIHCNLCETACPIINRIQPHNFTSPRVYSAYNKDLNIRYNSTSGGMYYAFAQWVIKNGGYIVGCSYSDDNYSAFHMITDNEVGLERIMRSKYFQSRTLGIYKSTKKILDDGGLLLFCGTPCQIAALYSFLGKDYDSLYTVDFVCRGINSPLAYRSFIKELENKYHSSVKTVHFKNKSHGWTNLGTEVTFENGKKYYRNKGNDPWVNAFVVGNLYMRPSCYYCYYKSLPRISDMSIGDFWGLKFNKHEAKYGVSLVMINNEKGERLFQKSLSDVVVRNKRLDEALSGNGAILKSVSLPKDGLRKEFFKRIESEPYSNVVWDLLDMKWPKWMIRGWADDVLVLISSLKYTKK